MQDKDSFSFLKVEKKEKEKENLNIDANKASKNSDISIKIVKEHVDIFCEFVYTSFDSSVKTSKFPGNLKLTDITSLFRKSEIKILKETKDQ